MAEASTRESKEPKDYTKSTQKFFSRTIEKMISGRPYSTKVNIAKVKHSIGKSDKTPDEDFKREAAKFNEQQAAAFRIQKELKAYISYAKALSAGRQSLYTAIKEIYEDDWDNSSEFRDHAEKLIAAQTAHLEELNARVIGQLTTYTSQFPPMKEKISKRSRKLVDYDAARHNVQSLENSKKRNDFKITEARRELDDAKAVYENINQELQRDLPALYDSRIPSLCSTFEVLLSVELEFASKYNEIQGDMFAIASKMNRVGAEGASSRLANSISSERIVNNYATHMDMKKFQRLSTPDEISKQPVLTAVSTNGKISEQFGYEGAVYSNINSEDIHVELDTKRMTSVEYSKPTNSNNMVQNEVKVGVQLERQLSPNETASIIKSSDSERRSLDSDFRNGPLENGDQMRELADVAAASNFQMSPPQNQQKLKMQSSEEADSVFHNRQSSNDSFGDQFIMQQRQQEELLNEKRNQEMILQDNQANLIQIQDNENDLFDMAAFSPGAGPITDSATSFINPDPLAVDFFAAKKNAAAVAHSKGDVILYSVMVTNAYKAQDEEELNIEPGHVINVVQPNSDDEELNFKSMSSLKGNVRDVPVIMLLNTDAKVTKSYMVQRKDKKDEGWLLGVNMANGIRGLFPENFTQKLQ